MSTCCAREFRRVSVMYILHRWRKSRRLAGYRQPPGPRGTPITASSRDRRTLRQRVSAHGRGEQASGESQGSQSTPKRGHQKKGPRRPNTRPTPRCNEQKTRRNTQKLYNTLSQRATPNKSLPVALPLKSLTVSGVIVVHTASNVVASFLTVRFFASTCT